MRLDRRALLLAGLLTPAAAFAEKFAGKYNPVSEQIADGLWMVRGTDQAIAFANGGAIANSAIIATDAGAVLFDPAYRANTALRWARWRSG